MTDVILALIGTRQCIRKVNADITRTMDALDRATIIVTGNGTGVDVHVKREAKRLGFRLAVFHARETNGKWTSRGSGPERNELIARIAQRVIAWPATPIEEREMSSGTWGCVELFWARKKPADVREVAWRDIELGGLNGSA